VAYHDRSILLSDRKERPTGTPKLVRAPSGIRPRVFSRDPCPSEGAFKQVPIRTWRDKTITQDRSADKGRDKGSRSWDAVDHTVTIAQGRAPTWARDSLPVKRSGAGLRRRQDGLLLSSRHQFDTDEGAIRGRRDARTAA